MNILLSHFDIYFKCNLRLFIEAILYRNRTGCPWHDLPKVFGKPTPWLRSSLQGLKPISNSKY
ncbi:MULTISPECIES: transposase [Acinetobacter]|uniref:transposase n=1 Tax=Acinetobacter TaxID=469 RepID=UPI00103F1999|nr:transposase [Acinetobacter sp. ANC 3781]